MSTSFTFSRMSCMKSIASSSSSPRARRTALTAAFMKYALLTPGISTGYWNARKSPRWARSSGSRARRSSPSQAMRPAVTS